MWVLCAVPQPAAPIPMHVAMRDLDMLREWIHNDRNRGHQQRTVMLLQVPPVSWAAVHADRMPQKALNIHKRQSRAACMLQVSRARPGHIAMVRVVFRRLFYRNGPRIHVFHHCIDNDSGVQPVHTTCRRGTPRALSMPCVVAVVVA